LARVSKLFPGWTPEEVDLARRTVGPDATEHELALFLRLCKTYRHGPQDFHNNWTQDGGQVSIHPQDSGVRREQVKTQEPLRIPVAWLFGGGNEPAPKMPPRPTV